MIPDLDLIKEIKAGSHSAMEVLVKRYYKQIYSFIYRKIGNKDIAYDLTQEVFMKMLKSIHSYKEKAQFKTWLYTLAVNHCNDYFRSKAFRAMKKSEELGDTHVSNDNIPYIFEKKEKRREIMNAIKSLPEYQSNTILLRFYHDFKIKEIADIMQTNDSTVKSRLRQGMGRLKLILQRGDDNEAKRS